MIHGMNRFTVTAEDRGQTLAFYCDLLGLHEGHRPDLGFPGAWLYAGGLRAVDANLLVQKSLTFSRPVVFDYVATRAELDARAQRLWSALADGTVHKPLLERHSLEAAAQAHQRLESRRTVGSLVLVV